MTGHRSFTTALAVLFLAAPLAAQGVPGATGQNLVPALAPVAASLTAPPTAPVAGPIAAPVAAVTVGAPSDRAPSLAPTRGNVAVGVRALATPAAPFRPTPRQSDDRSTAMMIVGGSGILLGAIVGGRAGEVVMVGGGIIGLVGLWEYLR